VPYAGVVVTAIAVAAFVAGAVRGGAGDGAGGRPGGRPGAGSARERAKTAPHRLGAALVPVGTMRHNRGRGSPRGRMRP
jgi:hypothetical protein